MTQEEIKNFIKKFKWRFKRKHLLEIEKWLLDASDEDLKKIKKSVKSPFKISFFAFFLCMFAIDRFALKQPFLALLKIVWVWGFFALCFITGIVYFWILEGTWPLIDYVTAPYRTYNYNYKVVKKILNK